MWLVTKRLHVDLVKHKEYVKIVCFTVRLVSCRVISERMQAILLVSKTTVGIFIVKLYYKEKGYSNPRFMQEYCK